MANIYLPDPYQGWSNINPISNNTAHAIMTDTSGQWRLVAIIVGMRIYQR